MKNKIEKMPALHATFCKGKMPDLKARKGFGINEVIGIAAGIIIAVVVVIPGLQSFAVNVLGQLTKWWNSMAAGIFTG